MHISDDPRIKDFLKNRPLKPNTIKRYLRHLTIYSEVTGLTPSKLIDQAEDEEDEKIRMRKRKIKKHLLDFKEELENLNYSSTHIRNAITNIRTFYHEFEIELPKIKLSSKNSSLETYADIPTKTHIKKALEYANSKYKAIILLILSSGMGASEIVNLTVEDFINSISKCFKQPINFPFNVDQIKQQLEENEGCIAIWNICHVKMAGHTQLLARLRAYGHIKLLST